MVTGPSRLRGLLLPALFGVWSVALAGASCDKKPASSADAARKGNGAPDAAAPSPKTAVSEPLPGVPVDELAPEQRRIFDGLVDKDLLVARGGAWEFRSNLVGEVAYEWVLNGDDRPREQQFTARLAVAYPAARWFTPLLELATATQTRGPTAPETSLLHKTQVYLVPGCNVRPRPGMTLRVGVQVPVTTAKAFDYRFHSALVVEF